MADEEAVLKEQLVKTEKRLFPSLQAEAAMSDKTIGQVLASALGIKGQEFTEAELASAAAAVAWRCAAAVRNWALDFGAAMDDAGYCWTFSSSPVLEKFCANPFWASHKAHGRYISGEIAACIAAAVVILSADPEYHRTAANVARIKKAVRKIAYALRLSPLEVIGTYENVSAGRYGEDLRRRYLKLIGDFKESNRRRDYISQIFKDASALQMAAIYIEVSKDSVRLTVSRSDMPSMEKNASAPAMRRVGALLKEIDAEAQILHTPKKERGPFSEE